LFLWYFFSINPQILNDDDNDDKNNNIKMMDIFDEKLNDYISDNTVSEGIIQVYVIVL